MTILDYAPSIPWYRRKRFRRRILAILTLALLIAATYLLGPRCYRRAMLLYRQHQCMTYVNPPGTVALDVPAAASGRSGATGRPFPAVWNDFEDRILSTRRRWANEYWMIQEMLGSDHTFVFLHGRTSAGGKRLILVKAHSDTPGRRLLGTRHSGITTSVVIPSSVLGDPEAPIIDGDRVLLPLHQTDTLRVYTGQPDPTDPASLTVDFDLNATRHTARFTLTPAGDRLDLISVTPPIPSP